MRGDTATDEHAKSTATTEAACGDRRSSVVSLQNMLKKVSQSPLRVQYQSLVASGSESSGSSANESQNNQDGDYPINRSAAAAGVMENHQLRQNGVKTDESHLDSSVAENGVNGLARMNPFYAYYLESGSNSNTTEDTSEQANLDAIFVPPPEFQSSPLEVHSEEKGDNSSEPQVNLFQTLSHQRHPFQTSTQQANSLFHNVTLNSPAQEQNVSKGEVEDIFRSAKEKAPYHAASSTEVNLFEKSLNVFVDPFEPPLKKEDDLFQAPKSSAANPFYTSTMDKDMDLFHAGPNKSEEPSPFIKLDTREESSLDVFSSSSVDPFPSPITRTLFQDVSSLEDPFAPSPPTQVNPFMYGSTGTLDISKPLPPTRSTTPLKSPSEKVAMLSSPKRPPLVSPPPIPPKPSVRPQQIILTTPQGTKHDINQPTPLSQSRTLSGSPSQSPAEMTHVQTFKRPPRPLPRTRPPKTVKTPEPEQPQKPERPPLPVTPIQPEQSVTKTSPKLFRSLPKPVIQRKPKSPDVKPVEPANYVVFEDILLIGQERCVEDWPEDSPELNPDFKPSGKFRLRRESLKVKVDSDGGSGEEQDGKGSPIKKKEKKFRMPQFSRRGSKEKLPDDTKEAKSRTLPVRRKSSKDYFSDVHMSAGENEDEEQDYKKTPLKTKVNKLLRRASTSSSVPEGKHVNGHQDSKDDDLGKKSNGKKNSIIRRWSEGTVLDDSTGEEEQAGDGPHDEKRSRKMKIKFVPHRGFAISLKKPNEEPKGAHGYTPRKGSKDKTFADDEEFGACGYTPRKKSQDDAFEDVEEIKSRLHSTSQAAFMDDEHFQKTHCSGPHGDEDEYGVQDCKPKKPSKMKLPRVGRRSSQENMLDDRSPSKKKGSFSAEELDDEDLADVKMKPHKNTAPVRTPRQQTGSNGTQQASADELMGAADMYDSEQEELDSCKPKPSKLKGLIIPKSKSKDMQLEFDDPPGATSADYLSEAAKAEWLAAQMDERAMAGLDDEEEEGDTDSLMEWWYTVEKWDEVPSDEEEKTIKEDESKSFTILADKVHNGLRVFNKVFTERAEVLWQSIITLHTIADDISNFHQKAKIAGITGGTTTAVGGVTAIAGLALAPFTFGASLVVTAVGVGVATAGGITSASAAISDNVNNMNDRKKVESVLQEYEEHLLDIRKILHFINQGLYKLRGHPFLRSGTQHYSKDWEVRRAVQMISFVDTPVMRATDITDNAVASLQGLFKGMDKYFIKDSRELKKGCKKEMVSQIKEVANMLNNAIMELNTIREELQDATGNM
ncbi:uncharacterized protein LOC114435853 isoform X2 [Parambassis ranga]|uniref:Uncharacterized protein LOC114435853 isoform X2 n=1 Tax=Parambassis ranga TaxID=210632 RepID=A0A6P7I0R3_9TELE|nr:uncharacterized protein LOC114435853 isoform X2 [Parambassis ranga]